MQTMKTPPSDHGRFDELCARLGDWEPMMSATATPLPEIEAEDDQVRDAGAMDDLILAGLVSPY
jgi:hypothetical protein